jgi:hypothetical protein
MFAEQSLATLVLIVKLRERKLYAFFCIMILLANEHGIIRRIGASGASDAAVNSELLNWAKDNMEQIQVSSHKDKVKLHASVASSF